MKLDDELRGALSRLENTLDGPNDGESIGRMRDRFVELSEPLVERMRTDGKGPIYVELPITKPRLSGRVDELRADLRRIRNELGAIAESARTLSGDNADGAIAFRRRTRKFIDLLRDHEQREVDLLQTAYWREVGGSD